MATLLLNCGAAISSRIRARRQAKEEREREYAENFEKLQAENEKRVKRLSAMSQQYDLINDPMFNSKALPTAGGAGLVDANKPGDEHGKAAGNNYGAEPEAEEQYGGQERLGCCGIDDNKDDDDDCCMMCDALIDWL
ncbi:hypothetical protein UCRNP2_6605 [Neofusicoccum parvum UCRNP2]|uniref:Uncharacterized protein n=1 Tax=Botryosphaeria parva (strain UCR-NP2) TaxID=1287680 RepID=R1GKZ4_BOTPV|nr:hypothetical protein UCRNP2_6605 [Neofusicoccum parvum UCRNP2]